MLNRNYNVFERNHYFYGKLLTSKDFQSEQEYLNNKRRFLNRVLHGPGIAYGLNVLKADDASVIVQSGFALDGSGREVLVPKTQVIKLATLEGYSQLQTNHLYLGIAYQEDHTEPTYAAMGAEGTQEEQQQFNHIREGYRLFLMDENACTPPERREDCIGTTVIYQDEDVKVIQKTPIYVAKDRKVRVVVEVEKLSHAPLVFSFKYNLTAEGFTNKKLEVRADNLKLDCGERSVQEYQLIPEDYIFGGNQQTLEMQDIEIQKTDRQEKLKKVCQADILPVSEQALDHMLTESYKGILDTDLESSYEEKLWIAKITVVRSGSSVMIDSISQAPMRQYVYNTRQLMAYQKLQEFLPPQGQDDTGAENPGVLPIKDLTQNPATNQRVHSSGVFEMSLGNGGEAGRVYYSDEIMHGLGTGSVYVAVGVEYLSKDKGQEYQEIILGDNSIFAGQETKGEEKVHQLDSAVKILPDRGTFVVGVRPKTKTGKISLRIRWFALKPEDLQQRVTKREQNGCIMIQPDTIVVGPKATVHINAVFINMPEEPLTYTLLDSEGGKIENNGMYTAPAQEGVYEVQVACVGNPEIFAQAFIVVSQKKEEEEDTKA